jgi:S1-C subfamily serine protease
MEHFTKQQLILLMLLIAFVSSIVTGITTVSLMAQDPQGVTQTINRVVERTIEKVAAPDTNGAAVAGPAKEVTVVVKEEEFVTKAVQEARDAIVRIKNKRDGALLGIGIVINNEGLIVADRNATISFRDYSGVYQGVTYDLVLDKNDKKSGVITFKFKDSLPPNLNPIAIGDSNKVLAGQSVVAVSGADRDTVSIGIVSSIIRDNDEAKSIFAIDTTVSQGSLLSGTPLMNLEGRVVALKIGKDEEENDIMMPIANVLAAVNTLASTQ